MFDSLDDQMKANLNRESTGKERLLAICSRCGCIGIAVRRPYLQRPLL